MKTPPEQKGKGIRADSLQREDLKNVLRPERNELRRMTSDELAHLREELQPLVGTQFPYLALPKRALESFEPSQIGTIVGTLMDAMIPFLTDEIPSVGLTKHEGILKDREGYPDYRHKSGYRLELKLLYTDNPSLPAKKAVTPREPSARLTQKVTVKNVDPAKDALLLIAYQLRERTSNPQLVVPTITALEVLIMIELVEMRDQRLVDAGGRWFGNYETPAVISKAGREKLARGLPLDASSYGRKESEGRDFNEDTNFGKLKRIPHSTLQSFLRKHKAV
jgi:hypothetical protein